MYKCSIPLALFLKTVFERTNDPFQLEAQQSGGVCCPCGKAIAEVGIKVVHATNSPPEMVQSGYKFWWNKMSGGGGAYLYTQPRQVQAKEDFPTVS